MPATGTRVDPYRGFTFLVEIDDIVQAGFSECSGFGATAEMTEYREGGEKLFTRKLPGMTKFNNVTLKWGLTDSHDLYDWFRNITTGIVDRRQGSIIVLDLEGNEKVRWNFFRAWPTRWDGPDFNASTNAVAIETLELAVEEIQRA